MSGRKQPLVELPLKEEEDDHEGIIKGLQQYVEQLTVEQGKALMTWLPHQNQHPP